MRATIVGAFSFALLTSTGCATLGSILSGNFQRPELSLENVEITGISPTHLSTRLSLGVRNPNSFAIELAALEYGFAMENNELAKGRTDQKINVPAGESSTVVFPVQLGLSEVVAAIGSLFQKESLGYQIHLGLGFESPAGTIEVPLDHSGTFPAPRPPKINIAGVKAARIGATGADLEISLDVANPNGFPIPAGALDYRFDIAGAKLASGSVTPPPLEGSSKTTITIPVRVDFAGATSGLVAALGRGELEVALGGSLDVAGSKLPLSTSSAVSLR